MDAILSIEICKRFEWELEIIKQIDKSYTSFMFGFVEYPRDESIKYWSDHYFGLDGDTKSKQFGVYVSTSFTYFPTYGARKADLGEEITVRWKEGDRFTVIADFERGEIDFMFNDKYIDVAFHDMPPKIVPVICIYAAVELKCTKYDFV